jgi:hypothetical protein
VKQFHKDRHFSLFFSNTTGPDQIYTDLSFVAHSFAKEWIEQLKNTSMIDTEDVDTAVFSTTDIQKSNQIQYPTIGADER